MTSPTLFETLPKEKLGKAALNRWKLETLTGLLGYRALQHHQAESEKNQQAENQHVRKQAFGYEEQQPSGDDMGHTILGDVTHPTPIIMNQQPASSPLLPIALAALAAVGGTGLLGAGAVAGYLLAPKAAEVEPAEFNDETLRIGLGKIEDYVASEKE